jgi:signal transduction histidine kinase
MEATHRTPVAANARLTRLNQALSRRTRELADANRKLKQELARRAAAEESLRKSEQHYTRLLAQSRRMQGQMQLLSRRVLSVQEEERKRISRELHDVIAQMLTGINVRLAALKREAGVNTKGLDRKISSTQRLVEKSVDTVHRFARELRPAVLDDLGLIPTLHTQLKAFMKETGTRASLTAAAEVEQLSISKRTVLYRIAQEALANVARHAEASRADVSIRKFQKTVRMQIRDDGKAFDVEQMWHTRKSRHLGLLGMRERVEMVGGTFTVESVPGRGTTIDVEIPFHKNGKERR